jgi:hypothetical protein
VQLQRWEEETKRRVEAAKGATTAAAATVALRKRVVKPNTALTSEAEAVSTY